VTRELIPQRNRDKLVTGLGTRDDRGAHHVRGWREGSLTLGLRHATVREAVVGLRTRGDTGADCNGGHMEAGGLPCMWVE
jgi:hypothetical protein